VKDSVVAPQLFFPQRGTPFRAPLPDPVAFNELQRSDSAVSQATELI
jgi:hypothetical protein